MGRVQEEAAPIDIYDIQISPEAQKGLLSISRTNRELIADAIDDLALDPRPDNSLKLAIGGNLRRLKVGDYRVIYGIEEPARRITIELVRHRNIVYTLVEALKRTLRGRGVRYSR